MSKWQSKVRRAVLTYSSEDGADALETALALVACVVGATFVGLAGAVVYWVLAR